MTYSKIPLHEHQVKYLRRNTERAINFTGSEAFRRRENFLGFSSAGGLVARSSLLSKLVLAVLSDLPDFLSAADAC